MRRQREQEQLSFVCFLETQTTTTTAMCVQNTAVSANGNIAVWGKYKQAAQT